MALYEAKKSGRNRTKTWKDIKDGGTRQRLELYRIQEFQNRVADVSAHSKEVFVQSMWGLVQAIEARDKHTRSHSDNVMRYAVAIAEAMGVCTEDIDVIRRAAMIHDVGKIGVPDNILRKPGPLTSEERAVIEQHTLIGVRILDQMRFLERELPIVRSHHERWDGNGYPDGISGMTIPLGARVLGVADAFDAITADRVYRKSRPVSQALAILAEGSGSQFDPTAVEAMLRWVEQTSSKLGKDDDVTSADLLNYQKQSIVAA